VPKELAKQLKYIYGVGGQAELKKLLAGGTSQWTGNWTGTY